MTLRKIFLTYFKIGCMAFGGGIVMLPLVQNEFGRKQGIITDQEACELFALAQSVPGIVAVNMAVFLGHKLGGIKGAITAAIAVMLPSIIVITIVAAFFRSFADIPWVQRIFHGLNIAVLAVIARALWQMAKNNIKDIPTLAIFIIVLAAYLITGFNPVIFTVAGTLAGLLLAGRGEKNA